MTFEEWFNAKFQVLPKAVPGFHLYHLEEAFRVGAAWQREQFAQLQFNGCFTGDCPHELQSECVDALEKELKVSFDAPPTKGETT